MKYVLSLFFLALVQLSNAQSKWKPWGVTEAGFIVGSYGPSGDLRLQGGLKKNNWMFGAGAAYDGYRFETLPVYAQARKMFGNKKVRPFVMASAGVDFEIEEDNPASDLVFIWAPPVVHYLPGYYADLGAGVAFRTHKRFGYNVSFSYSRKTLTETSTYQMWNGSKFEQNTTETKYLMNRYAFRIAMQF